MRMKFFRNCIGVFLAALLLISCDAEMKLMEATKQPYSGGAAGSSPGIHYAVKLQKPKGIALTLSGVWMGDKKTGKSFEAQIAPEGGMVEISKSEVPADIEIFSVRFTERFAGEGNPRNPEMKGRPANPGESDAPKWLPADFESGCILMFSANGTQTFVRVASWKELEKMHMP